MIESGDARPGARWIEWTPALLLPVLLLAYHLLFGRFFPNSIGGVGEDYALELPALLSGDYWFRANGPLAVPWFTPAFCGGQPLFADVQSIYYSLPQWLSFVLDPLTSCYVTVLAFAAVGYAGTWLLLRRCFGAGRPAALVGATVFMFNGFYAHRMIVGHLGFHGFMLVPWLAHWLLAPERDGTPAARWRQRLVMGWLFGLALAYLIHSGMGSLLVPVALAVVLLLLLHTAHRDALGDVPALVARLGIGAATAAALTASKLAAAFAFMSYFPRAQYLLPGYRTVLDSARIALLGLFASPADIQLRSEAALVNSQWPIGRHELEYGVTPIPLVLLVGGAALMLARRRASRAEDPGARRVRAAAIAGMGLLVALPILLNTYGVEWNALLKRTPLIRSSSSLVRWYLAYVPLLAALSALALEAWRPVPRAALAAVAIAAIVGVNLAEDRRSYVQGYSPATISRAHRELAERGAGPPVAGIDAQLDPDGWPVLTLDRNNRLAQGLSPMLCYNPFFGYGLESFPLKALHPGPVREILDGRFNVKNPACYVFPRENRCEPGDHFLASQRDSVERFVAYRPFPFEASRVQVLAGAVTEAGLAASVLLFLALGIHRLRQPRVDAPRGIE